MLNDQKECRTLLNVLTKIWITFHLGLKEFGSLHL